MEHINSRDLKHAIDLIGGPTKVANLLGVSTAAIYIWLNKGGTFRKVHALKLAKVTGVDYQKLWAKTNNKKGDNVETQWRIVGH